MSAGATANAAWSFIQSRLLYVLARQRKKNKKKISCDELVVTRVFLPSVSRESTLPQRHSRHVWLP